MPLRADGVVQTIATYSLWGLNSEMVFHSWFDHPPTFADCDATVNAYGMWEDSLALSPRSYRAHRSQDSYLVQVKSTSIDSSSYAVQSKVDLDLQGELSNLDQLAYPAGVCPLIRWHAPHKRRTRYGRTYAACTTPELADGTDLSRLSSEGRLIMAAVFSDLIDYFRVFGGGTLVLLEYQRAGVKLVPAPSYEISEASCEALTLSTQCRRMVPGRG